MNIVGLETRDFPNQAGRSVRITAVLVQGTNNDIACYVGCGSKEWVADNGDKISLREAKTYFPNIEGEMERFGVTYRGSNE